MYAHFVELILQRLDCAEDQGCSDWRDLNWTVEQYVQDRVKKLETRWLKDEKEPYFLRLGCWRVGNIVGDVIMQLRTVSQRTDFKAAWKAEGSKEIAATLFMKQFTNAVIERCDSEYELVMRVLDEKGLPAFIKTGTGRC